MAGDSRAVSKKRRRSKRLRYIYINDQLHKVLSVNRPLDLVVCWNYCEHKRAAYTWSTVRKTHGKAYTTAQVAELIGRHRVNIEKYILSGNIRPPQRAYALNENRKPGAYYFSEKDVYELHDYLLTVHRGRPRKDGRTTPSGIPSRAELRAMMVSGSATYVKNDDGEFIQVWKENDW